MKRDREREWEREGEEKEMEIERERGEGRRDGERRGERGRDGERKGEKELFVWLVVFYVPSTARSFRDGTPIYCPLRRTFPPGIEPGPWHCSPLHNRCATPAPLRKREYEVYERGRYEPETVSPNQQTLHQPSIKTSTLRFIHLLDILMSGLHVFERAIISWQIFPLECLVTGANFPQLSGT